MFKQLCQLEHKIGNNVYQFECDPNSPLPEVKEAILKFLEYVISIENQVKAQQQQESPPAEPIEQPKIEAING